MQVPPRKREDRDGAVHRRHQLHAADRDNRGDEPARRQPSGEVPSRTVQRGRFDGHRGHSRALSSNEVLPDSPSLRAVIADPPTGKPALRGRRSVNPRKREASTT
jgi:hypothetical protein